MELNLAIEKAFRILEEERVRPTLGYRYVSAVWPHEMRYEESSLRQQGYTASMAAILGLERMRERHPREVEEDPKLFQFESINYNLLLTLFSQISENDRLPFISALLKKLLPARPNRVVHQHRIFPSFDWNTSGLGLLAEFCVRTRNTQALLEATLELQMPTPGLAVMLIEMEEMIALNFNIFSEAEIKNLPTALTHLREIAHRQTYFARGPRGAARGQVVQNKYYQSGFEAEAKQIVDSIKAIAKQCEQAAYWYLKGELQQAANLEIESDKTKVIGFLDGLGFDPLLTSSLKKAEDLYKPSADAFDLKSCLGHIRSFYEHLSIDGGMAIAAAHGASVVREWDPILTFLKNNGFFTQQQDKFARGLYALLSDEGVHPLIAEREFARLLRNVVIEYGLMFLTMLQKKGVRVRS
jgi:hypothetical protein